ncbi:MAG: response regulator [Planctomycetota bacterium]
MRILLAEDDGVTRTLLVRVLRGLGHEPVATKDGEEAWRVYCQQPFPVVVTDWLMPGTDGLELTRRIRAARARSYPWIILLTAMDYSANFRRTMEEGVDDFLTKPVDHELLRVRLTVAARVNSMSEQVRLLAAALPICMHCKAVRDAGDHWQKVEEFFDQVDFSHGYCPGCYYEHSLRPELERLRATAAWHAPGSEAPLDPRTLNALIDFDGRESPGLFNDLCEGWTEAVQRARQILQSFRDSGLLGHDEVAALASFRKRCLDLGAGRLAEVLRTDYATPPALELLQQHAERGSAALAELDATVAALAALRRARRESQPQPS